MLISLIKELWQHRARRPVPASLDACWRVYGDADLQRPFDVAVVMPSVGRASLPQAVQSVFEQAYTGRIQLLIGVDAPLADFCSFEAIFRAAPAHVAVCLFYPGYSTSVRHGGLYPARDGGVLRCILTYLANARYVAYLDDDNWWNPLHLQSLQRAITGHQWAYGERWFIHPESRRVVIADDWESVGIGHGLFRNTNGGWADPNSLMVDKFACEQAIRLWNIPIAGDNKAMTADRTFYSYLQQVGGAPGISGLTSTYYNMQADDIVHVLRLDMIGEAAYDQTAAPQKDTLPLSLSLLLPSPCTADEFLACLAAWAPGVQSGGELEFIVCAQTINPPEKLPAGVTLRIAAMPDTASLTARLNACYRQAHGDYLLAIRAATRPLVPDWAERLAQLLHVARDGIIALDLHAQRDMPCLVSRRLCAAVGAYWLPTSWHMFFEALAAGGCHRHFVLRDPLLTGGVAWGPDVAEGAHHADIETHASQVVQYIAQTRKQQYINYEQKLDMFFATYPDALR